MRVEITRILSTSSSVEESTREDNLDTYFRAQKMHHKNTAQDASEEPNHNRNHENTVESSRITERQKT